MTDTSAPPTGTGTITELRVHGVSGSPASVVLNRPLVQQVAGDHDAGFYRPRPDYAGQAGRGKVELEAYSWGNLTSGAAARAFWLLLLPFTLANVAPWMRPATSQASSPRWFRRVEAIVLGLCRTLALSLTGTLVVASAGVSMDLLGWQCTGSGNECGRSREYLSPLTEGFLSEPGRRLAITALVPLAVIAVLWYLARRTWIHYERFRSDGRDGTAPLAQPGFWFGRHLVGRLRSIHISVALATVSAVLTYPILGRDLAVRSDPLQIANGATIGLAAIAVIVAGVGLLWVPVVTRVTDPARWMVLLLKGLRTVSLSTVFAALGYAMLPRADWPTTGSLPGFSGTVTMMFAGQVVLLLALTVAVAPLRSAVPTSEQGRMVFGGFATPVVATLALFTAASFSAGVFYRVADWFSGEDVPNPFGIFSGDQPVLQALRPYEWAAFGFTIAVVGALVFVGVARGWLLPTLVARARLATDIDFPGGRAADPDRAADIDREIGEANLVDRAAPWLAALLVPVLVFAAAIVIVVVAIDVSPSALAPDGSRLAAVLVGMTNAGTWLIGASAFGLVLLGIRTYQIPALRRLVGVVWDLATFWPRAAHPLAPPCYAERVVPELVTRVSWLARNETDSVVLSGHSQGSVLVAAAVLQLPVAVRRRVSLLTYGSPLRRLYSRYFPAYFGPMALCELAGSLTAPTADRAQTRTRWINLWRVTDPIGGPISLAPVADRRLIDPPAFGILPGDTVAPRISTHGDYTDDVGYDKAVADLVAMTAPP